MEYRGTVQEGSQLASELGFPTMNIAYEDPTISGVYAALVRIDRQEHPAAVYVDTKRGVLEAHVFGWKERLYGETVGIRLIEKIRDDREFKEGEAKAAIEDDVQKARAYFSL